MFSLTRMAIVKIFNTKKIIIGGTVRVNIEEVKKPELFAKLVAENIAHQLERRINFRRAVKMSAAATMRAGAKGVRIEVAGRLNNAEMSRREKVIEGSVPLHTIRADVDYALAEAMTGAGVIGGTERKPVFITLIFLLANKR